jgi:diacylglycerol kinase (ATP)
MLPPEVSPYKSTHGLQRVFLAMRYSIQGLKAAIHYEAAFRQELALAIVLIPAAFWLGRSMLEICLLVFPLVLVLIIELLNSAIEALADALSTQTHPLLGRAKDLGSAAVLLGLIFTLAIWVGVIIRRFSA